MSTPLISVIIPTRNRAELLRGSLASLACQTLAPDKFEVIVIDDGATDATRDVCLDFSTRMQLQCFSIEHAGTSAAKNLGIFASRGPIILFFDDDDYATPTLLREHLAAHRRYPDEHVAVLGYTAWAPALSVTEVMHYVMDVGRLLFCYTMADGQTLDFTYFWAGRTSCKRAYLAQHGIYRQELRSAALEDIELGYRLSKHRLQVIFHRKAVQYMNRPITFDEFCRRCERQGHAQYLFGRLYPGDAVVEKYCRLGNARQRWNQVKQDVGLAYFRVRQIEALLECQSSPADATALRSELHGLYRRTFDGFKLKGIVQAQDEAAAPADGRTAAACAIEPVVEPVVIHQMGKVGSKTIESSLAALELGAPLCHCHLLNGLDRIEENTRRTRSDPRETLAQIQHGRRLVKTILGTPYIRCRVISLVRDPVARNISAFFQNLTEFLPDVFRRYADGELTVEELHEVFLNHYDHDIPLAWFGRQLQPVFGIDVFASEFPKERGYAVYAAENVSLLVIKLEMLDECAADAMRDYLGLQDFVLKHANVAEDKEYKDIYKAFLRSIVLPDDYLNRMYESALARHFYTDAELQQFRARWSKRSIVPANEQRNEVPPANVDVEVAL